MNDNIGRICPGRYKPQEDLDSTFDFGSGSEDQDDSIPEFHAGNNAELSCSECQSDSGSNSEERSECELTDAEELWNTSDEDPSDEEEDTQVQFQSVLFGLFFFLNFFQLLFRISERAMQAMLKFIHLFISQLLSLSPGNKVLEHIHKYLPKSFPSIQKCLKNDGATEYVVCPRCFKLYDYTNCIVGVGSQAESLRCNHVEYPNHPQVYRRIKCNTELLKKIRVGRKHKLVPRKVYIYQGVLSAIARLCSRPGFLDRCNCWKLRRMNGPCTFPPSKWPFNLYFGNCVPRSKI